MATLLSLFVRFNVFVAYGFLLNNGNSKTGNASGSNNVVTLQSFLEFKEQIHLEVEQQHRTTEQVRETIKETLSILTSQLNEKLQEFSAKCGCNNSCPICNNVLQHNAELKLNVTNLQKELELLKIENLALKSNMAMLNVSFFADKAERMAEHSRLNGSLTLLTDKFNNIAQRVAFTACASTDQNKNPGYIVKFENIKTNIGVTDPSSFVSSGKFLCEHGGIYLVYVTLDAYNTYIDYYVYVNNSVYVQVVEQDNEVHYQRGDVAVTLNLHKGDTVWIQLSGQIYVNAFFSCLTIVRIK